jgi:hypothetical protein
MTDIRLIEYEPGRWRVDRREIPVARSTLPLPNVISDTMPPTEQVDGRFYTSKAAFRAVGRALGLTEVGNEKPRPKQRSATAHEQRVARRRVVKDAIEKVRAGHYERHHHSDGRRRQPAAERSDRSNDT